MEAKKKKYIRPIITRQKLGMMNKFGKAPILTLIDKIDTAAIDKLTLDYGTPLFVISEKKLRSQQRDALRIFRTRYPKVQFAWSYKTNYLDAVCSVFHHEGSWAEVVSEFEYDKAKRIGIPGNKIIFNGPDKTKVALTKAINDGASIHIDHFDELYSLIEVSEKIGKTARVAIRVNMDVGIYPKWDRFGFNYENGEALDAIKRIMLADNLNLIGLHCHIGTYMLATSSYQIAALKMTELFKRVLSDFNHSLEYIDLGGGFASKNTLHSQYLDASGMVPTFEDYADAITSGIFEHNLKASELPLLILETGRALVDEAGYLISKVIAHKRLSNGKRAVILDAGVNLLFTSFWYKHRITPTQFYGEHTEDSVLYGNLCMNIDVIRDEIQLPPIPVGDNLVIQNVGAYNMTQWMQFISLRPKVVMVMESGDVEVIRQNETLEYLTQLEHIPDSLKLK
jgi:diaminopimelate decarboxylase